MANQSRPPEGITPAAFDQSKYLVHSRLEIAAILGALRKAGSMVTAYFGSGNDFVLTCIVAVRLEQDELIADLGSSAAANEHALQAGAFTCVALHERVTIRFVGNSLRKTRFEGRDVFSMQFPATLLRLQRREAFRVLTPLIRPLKCIVQSQDGAPKPTELTIVDISCGGVAILDTCSPSHLEAGILLRGCRILFPDGGEVSADIKVKSTFEITLRNGTKRLRAGCEFVAMPGRDQAQIQRYISKLQREDMGRPGRR